VTWESSSGCSDMFAGVLGFFAKINWVYYKEEETQSEVCEDSEEIYRQTTYASKHKLANGYLTWSALPPLRWPSRPSSSADLTIFCYGPRRH
jgi:hypothetical protein